MGQHGIQLVISIILARLLMPEEFGLIAMLTLFPMLAQVFLDSGFGAALIQKQDASHLDECSIFYFNIAIGLIAAGLLCLVAPGIAAFYDQPLLTPLMRLLSLSIVINSFGLIQTTLLAKRLDFKTQAKVSLMATFFSGAIGITLARMGFGVWSLAIQNVSSSLFRTILLWLFCSWRPAIVFSLAALRKMFGFSSRLLASGLLNTLFDNIYFVIIGKLFPPASLGYYTQAQKLQQIPTLSLSNMVGRVTFPVFSTIQNDEARLKRSMQKALKILLFVNLPMMIGLAIVSKPLVIVLLTEKWLPAVPYLRLLCAVGLLYPLHLLNLNVLLAKGRSDLFFRLEIAKKILVIIAIVLTCRWGISAMIYGQIITSAFCCYLNSYYTGKLIHYPITEQMFDIITYVALGAAMGIGVYSVQWLAISSDLVLLVCQIITGVVLFAAMNWSFRTSAFLEILTILKDGLRLRRSDTVHGA